MSSLTCLLIESLSALVNIYLNDVSSSASLLAVLEIYRKFLKISDCQIRNELFRWSCRKQLTV